MSFTGQKSAHGRYLKKSPVAVSKPDQNLYRLCALLPVQYVTAEWEPR